MTPHSFVETEDGLFLPLPDSLDDGPDPSLDLDFAFGPEAISVFDPTTLELAYCFRPDDWPVDRSHAQTHTMLPEKVYKLCTSSTSISSEIAAKSDKSVGDIGDALYGSHDLKIVEVPAPKKRGPATQEELQQARECGKFEGTNPSDLFLRAFYDVLYTLEHDPLNGVVSPSMIGSTGVTPFAVIGPLHDILRHMSNLIVQAKKEVLLATNFWLASKGSRFITDALKELSKRAGARGEKVPVKIMYDRGSAKQVFDNHQTVPPVTYSGKYVELPSPEEVPNINLHVVNFHRPMLGTFHAKFMIVDRQIAITQSNNIQDNDNTEMMAQLEGPIVDGLWESFLVSWHKMIHPICCLNERAADKPMPTFQEESFQKLFTSKGLFRLPERAKPDLNLAPHMGGDPHYDTDIAGEIERMHAMLYPRSESDSPSAIVARHLNLPTGLDIKATAPDPTSEDLQYFPFIPLPQHEPFPIALVSRKPFGSPNHTSLHVPQNTAFLSLIHNAQRDIFIQTPDLNATPLFDAILAAIRRGVTITYYVCMGYNDAGELLPGQNGTNEMFAHSLCKALDADPGAGGAEAARQRLRVHYYVAKDQTRPIHNSFKKRSCHIKLLIADGRVAVQGSGNQDTQSWWQSQEVNVMLDSELVCAQWREAIERNQNTAAYGRATPDGTWRDAEGKEAEGSSGVDPGKFAWAKGMLGAVNKARGVGGF